MFSKIHPESISDFNFTKKNLMWLAGFRKENIKGLSSKIFFKKAHVRKIIQFSDAEVAANFDITPISTLVQRFTRHDYDWAILNDWPIQRVLTY